MKDLARQAVRLDLNNDFGHPTQAMGCFRVDGSVGFDDILSGLFVTFKD